MNSAGTEHCAVTSRSARRARRSSARSPALRSQEKLNVTLVEPGLVVEVGVDVARDASGRWRHPARWHRARPDLSPADVPA